MDKITNLQEHADKAIEWIWAALPSLLWAIFLLIAGTYLIRFINKMIRKFFARKDYDLALESFLQSFISIALKIILFVLVITQLGVQTTSLVAILASAGLAIGLALQGSLANFAGGVLILLFKPFKIGDLDFCPRSRRNSKGDINLHHQSKYIWKSDCHYTQWTTI